MKHLILFISFSLFYSIDFSQKINIVSQSIESDSSFYDIEKINKNEFWAGGENGILKKIDSLGNISSLNFPNEGLNILKIVTEGNYIFIVTDNAVIYRYDIINQQFIKKTFLKFKNRCFYDIIALQNGSLMVCGGTSGISKGEKKIPFGFIGIIDLELNDIKTVWKSNRKFVWSLLELENGDILASTFNGLNTKIIKTENNKDWTKNNKIKGLVHHIALLNNNVWFSGTRNSHFKETGIIQTKDQKQLLFNKTGCLWRMNTVFGNIISVTANGKLIMLDKTTSEINQIDTSPFAFYNIEKISESKILVVGHGKSICIIDFNE
jgi:hypothetical protein